MIQNVAKMEQSGFSTLQVWIAEWFQIRDSPQLRQGCSRASANHRGQSSTRYGNTALFSIATYTCTLPPHYLLLRMKNKTEEIMKGIILVLIWCCSPKKRISVLQVNLDKMFWSKPCSLALPRDSPLRVEEPNYQGIKRFMLRLMLFYSKQSKSIRGANVVYRRIISQVDKPPIYEGPIRLIPIK